MERDGRKEALSREVLLSVTRTLLLRTSVLFDKEGFVKEKHAYGRAGIRAKVVVQFERRHAVVYLGRRGRQAFLALPVCVARSARLDRSLTYQLSRKLYRLSWAFGLIV
jgi:hypothetical protein